MSSVAPEFCDANTPWADHAQACCSGCNWGAPECTCQGLSEGSRLSVGPWHLNECPLSNDRPTAPAPAVLCICGDRVDMHPLVRPSGRPPGCPRDKAHAASSRAPVPAVEGLTWGEKELLRPVLRRYAEYETAHDGPVFETVERIVAERVAAAEAEVIARIEAVLNPIDRDAHHHLSRGPNGEPSIAVISTSTVHAALGGKR